MILSGKQLIDVADTLPNAKKEHGRWNDEWDWLLIFLAFLIFAFWVDAEVREGYKNATPEEQEFIREEFYFNNRPDL